MNRWTDTAFRTKRRFTEKFLVGPERLAILRSRCWYRNMLGGWTHPHAMDFMSRREILSLSPAQLDYKLAHGSRAALPPELR